MAERQEAEPESPPIAWNPLTPGGVASYANAPLSQLVFTQVLIAGIAFAAVLLYLNTAWVPALDSAVERLPEQTRLAKGRLQLPAPSPHVLGENPLLSITWVTNDAVNPVADIELRLGPRGWIASSLLGHLTLPYPPVESVKLDRETLSPRWGAWRPAAMPGITALAALSLWFTWCVMAAVYAWPIRFFVFFRDKLTNRLGSWKLCAAGLLPAALFMSAAITLYTIGKIPLAGLLIAFVAHFVIGWLYIICGALALPLLPEAEQLRGNPFSKDKKKKPAKRGKNPFNKKR